MKLNERAKVIIDELIAIPWYEWNRSNEGGQVYFSVKGHAGTALYFSEKLMNRDADHPFCEDAMDVYRARLGDKSFAVEVWDEERCVCLLRWEDIDDIEVAEYKHGPWELMSFSLPPVDANHVPTLH